MMCFRSRILLASCALLVPLSVACERQETARVDVPPPTDQTATPAPGAAPAGTTAQMPPELENRSNQYVSAWNGNDPAAVANYFTEDATAMVGDSTYTGRAAIQQGWLVPNVPVVTNLQATTENVEQRGNDVVVSGRYTFTARPPQGPAEQGGGHASTTWTRAPDGTWRIRSTTVRPDAQP